VRHIKEFCHPLNLRRRHTKLRRKSQPSPGLESDVKRIRESLKEAAAKKTTSRRGETSASSRFISDDPFTMLKMQR